MNSFNEPASESPGAAAPVIFISIESLFNRSWYVIRDQLGVVAGISLMYFVGIGVMSMIPFVGSFLSTPFTAGYLVCLLKIRSKQEIQYSDIFWGFMSLNRFSQLLLSGFLVGFLLLIGLIFFILPGVWFAIASGLTTTYIVLNDDDAITGLKKSLAAVKGDWWSMFLVMLFIGLLFLLGALCFVVGILIAAPLAALILIHAAEDLKAKTIVKDIPAAETGSADNPSL